MNETPREAVFISCINHFVEREINNHPYGLYDFIMSQAEKPLIEAVLRRTHFNQTQTAKILGINRGTLRKKIKEYGL